MHEESTMNNNKLPYGYVSDLLVELRPRMRWVTKNIVNKAFLKYKKDVKNGMIPNNIQLAGGTVSSDLSGLDPDSSSGSVQTNP